MQRSIYSAFDFMRDLGGLLFLCVLFCSFLNKLFSFNKQENALVAQLYKKPAVTNNPAKRQSSKLKANS